MQTYEKQKNRMKNKKKNIARYATLLEVFSEKNQVYPFF